MDILILATSFVVCYVLTKLFLGRYSLRDLSVNIYRIVIDRDKNDIMESIRLIKRDKALNTKSKKKATKYQQEYLKFSIDNEYREEEFSKYIKSMKVKMYMRKTIILLQIITREVVGIAPIILLIFMRDTGLSLILSGIIMVIYSLINEYNIKRSLEFTMDSETARQVISRISIKIGIATTALNSQMHVLIFLILIRLTTNI